VLVRFAQVPLDNPLRGMLNRKLGKTHSMTCRTHVGHAKNRCLRKPCNWQKQVQRTWI